MKDKITIRVAAPSDAEELIKIYAPYVLNTAITFEYEVPTVEEFQNRISKTLATYPYLVAEDNTGIIGYAYARRFKERAAYGWAVELSVYVKKEVRRGGIGKRLYEKLEHILKLQGVTNLYAVIACPEAEDEYLDRNSIHFHEHMGYQKAGEIHKCGCKFGHWYNIVWMEKMINEHVENQSQIRTFAEIVEHVNLQ